MDSFEELVSRVKAITGLGAREASFVAIALSDDNDPEAVHSAADIARQARELGYEVDEPEQEDDDEPRTTPAAEVTMDPAQVLAEVYRVCPRVLTAELPRVGRAPKESVFYDEQIQRAIDSLPEEIRLLIAGVDLVNGQVTVELYDEANDVDRKIGPIDLTRYGSAAALDRALRVLIGRLPRVLSADFN